MSTATPDIRIDIDRHIEQIRQALGRSVMSFIEVGKCLLEAKDDLPHGLFNQMISRELPFGARTAQRFISIAQDKRLSNATHASHLPASWTTLHEITRLPDKTFNAAIKSGKIHPDVSRVEIVRLLPTKPRTSPTTNPKPKQVAP